MSLARHLNLLPVLCFLSSPDVIAQARSAIPPNVNGSAILSKLIGLADIDRVVAEVNLKNSSALFHTKIVGHLVCSKVDRKDAFDWIKTFDR
jgi:hypothetical protein